MNFLASVTGVESVSILEETGKEEDVFFEKLTRGELARLRTEQTKVLHHPHKDIVAVIDVSAPRSPSRARFHSPHDSWEIEISFSDYCAFSPDGALAVGNGSLVELVDIEDGRVLRRFLASLRHGVNLFVFSHDGEMIMSASAFLEDLRIHHVESGREMPHPTRFSSLITSFAFSADDTLIFVGGYDTRDSAKDRETIAVMSAVDGSLLNVCSGVYPDRKHNEYVKGILLFSDGKRILSYSNKGTVSVTWFEKERESVEILRFGRPLDQESIYGECLLLESRGLIVTSCMTDLNVWSFRSSGTEFKVEKIYNMAIDGCFSPGLCASEDESRCVAGITSKGVDKLFLFALRNGKPLPSMTAEERALSTSLSLDGSFIVVATLLGPALLYPSSLAACSPPLPLAKRKKIN